MEAFGAFGSWLKRRRRALDLTQAELARRVGCATITLQKIELEERRPSKEVAARLADALGLSPEDRATFIKVARADLASERLPQDRHAGRTFAGHAAETEPPRRPNNLPIQPTPFIGREHEVVALRDLLLEPRTRLVTLLGPGGAGKTRLALEVAQGVLHAVTQRVPDGVWFVDLAPVTDPTLVASTIAGTLGVKQTGGQALVESLLVYVARKQLLLVLDNLEQVTAAAPLVDDLLRGAPGLTVLATSRAVLGVYGEHDFPVPPLALPDSSNVPPGELQQYAAVRLFVERAQAARPDFALTPTNAGAVADICRRLDGLPLAIELAAVRVRILPPRALLERLGNALQVLTMGPRTLPARHQTLRATIDWSYNLLDGDEQLLLRRLGVFVGGWTLEAAEDVCTRDDAMQRAVLDGLQSLVDKSLLRQAEGAAGEARFTVLETIRAYALERLEASGESNGLRRQHATYFLELAEAAETQLWASDQLCWLDRLEHEHDNLRAALAWALDHDPAVALRIAGALAGFWYTRGYQSEGRRWLDRALILTALPAHGTRETAYPPALGLPADAVVYAKVLRGAGSLAHAQGDNARAEALFTEGLARARVRGDSRWIALLLNDLAELALHHGDVARSAALCAEGLPLARVSGDRGVTARLLLSSADLAWAQNDVVYAVSCYNESVTLLRALDDRGGLTWALLSRGKRALAQGEWQDAAELFAEGLELARSIGAQENTAWLLYATGRLRLEQRALDRAAAHFVESAQLLHQLGSALGVAVNLAGLATVMVHGQRPAQAAGLLSLAEAQWALVGARGWQAAAEHAEFECTVAVVRAQLDAESFATAWATGRAMTLEQAVANALDSDA